VFKEGKSGKWKVESLFRMSKMKFVFILLCFSTFHLYAQKRNVSFELGGVGGLASFNYSSNFHLKLPNTFYRVGFSFAPIDVNNGTTLIFPVLIEHKIPIRRHSFVSGIGQTLSLTTKGQFFILMPASLGIELNSKSQKMFYRFSYTPIISYIIDQQWQHWGGISIGYNLK
jgi:hypothetical protein